MKSFKSAFPNLFSVFYFFLNSWKLPHGLLYTHLLSPFLIVGHFRSGTWLPYAMFIAPVLVYSTIHVAQGAVIFSLLLSTIMALSTFAVSLTALNWLRASPQVERLFVQFSRANGAFAALAIALYFTPLQSEFWYLEKFTDGVTHFPRLKLFTYEASHYALISAPLALFFSTQFFCCPSRKTLINWVISLVPMALSMSFGVIASAALALVLAISLSSNKRARSWFAFLSIGAAITMLLVYAFYPNLAVFQRVSNMISGNDASLTLRLRYAYLSAWQIASEFNVYAGVGFGQIKEVMPFIAEKYYAYTGPLETVRIPNSVAETLAMFGISGLIIRFGLQLWLFMKFRVYDNLFQLAMFIFMFTYQFSGSFMVNLVEYIAWIFAFVPLFPQFDKIRLHSN